MLSNIKNMALIKKKDSSIYLAHALPHIKTYVEDR